MKRHVITFIISLLLAPMLIGQELTTIEILSSQFNRFNHEEVMFEGYIERYVAGTPTSSSYYEIKGEYGSIIRVNTTQPSPEINQRYRVTGTMTIDEEEPLIIESNKRKVDIQGYSLTIITNPPEGGSVSPSGRMEMNPGETINITSSSGSNFKFENYTMDNRVISTDENFSFQMPESNAVIVANFKKNMTIWFVGAGILVLLIIILIVILSMKRSKQNKPQVPVTGEPIVGPPPTHPDEGQMSGKTIRINTDQNYSTVKLQQNAPATVKFIPGELEIINGLDKGKSFKMAGYPTSDGNVATIGRDHEGWQSLVSPERQYAHIRLKDESNTLSRMQAELVHRGGKLYMKNLSKVNPAQVDGEDVPVNEVVEIKPGSVIKTGFIEFKYKV